MALILIEVTWKSRAELNIGGVSGKIMKRKKIEKHLHENA